jgi:hypothetical protein
MGDFRSNTRLVICDGAHMVTRARAAGVAVMLWLAGLAGAQVAPPPAASRDAAGASAGGAAVRANQPLTVGVFLGQLKGQPIFVTDVLRPIDANLREVAAKSADPVDFEAAAKPLIRKSLGDLATDILVVSVAESKLTEQDKDRVQIILALEKSKLLASYGGVESAAERALGAMGSSIEHELRARRRGVIKRLYLEKYVWSQVVVTRQMVVDAYDKDPKRWQEGAAAELYILTLPVSRWLRAAPVNGEAGPVLANPTDLQIKEAETQALATGREIVGKLKAKAEFARLVEDYNSADEFRDKGGSRGMVSKGSMLDTKLEDFIFSLPANTIGEPYLNHESNFRDSTVRVVKVGEKRTARMVPFEEAEPVLYRELTRKQQEDRETQVLQKLQEGSLRELDALDRNSSWAVDAAVGRYVTK